MLACFLKMLFYFNNPSPDFFNQERFFQQLFFALRGLFHLCCIICPQIFLGEHHTDNPCVISKQDRHTVGSCKLM